MLEIGLYFEYNNIRLKYWWIFTETKSNIVLIYNNEETTN